MEKLKNWFYAITEKLDSLTGIKYDKWRHFGVGLGIYLASFLVMLVALWSVSFLGDFNWSNAFILMYVCSSILVILAAFYKEDKDKYEGGIFDWWDLFATVLGGLAGLVLTLLIF